MQCFLNRSVQNEQKRHGNDPQPTFCFVDCKRRFIKKDANLLFGYASFFIENNRKGIVKAMKGAKPKTDSFYSERDKFPQWMQISNHRI